MLKCNQDSSTFSHDNLIAAMNKLNEALSAFSRSLNGINSSVKTFHHLAEDCKKFKL